jgi:CspA family cold shock protein
MGLTGATALQRPRLAAAVATPQPARRHTGASRAPPPATRPPGNDFSCEKRFDAQKGGCYNPSSLASWCFLAGLANWAPGVFYEVVTRMAEGTIKRLTDKGYGFIETSGGQDIFFHLSNLEDARFDDLYEGQKVTFTEGRGPKGPRAENVKPQG